MSVCVSVRVHVRLSMQNFIFKCSSEIDVTWLEYMLLDFILVTFDLDL